MKNLIHFLKLNPVVKILFALVIIFAGYQFGRWLWADVEKKVNNLEEITNAQSIHILRLQEALTERDNILKKLMRWDSLVSTGNRKKINEEIKNEKTKRIKK